MVRFGAALPVLAAIAAWAQFAVPAAALRSGRAARALEAATPVSKVIELLGRLGAQIEEEGKTEAAEYDKYACFCKEQADSKTYAIEKSGERIGAMTAKVNELEAEIAELGTSVTALGQRITELEGLTTGEKDKRSAELKKFQIADANVTEAIDAVKGAIEAMKASKAKMASADLDFAQLGSVVGNALTALSGLPRGPIHPTDAQLRAVTALIAPAPAGKPQAYTYHSNDILNILSQLLIDFKENKKALYESEFNARSDSEKLILSYTNEKEFTSKEKVEKEEAIATKTEAKQATEKDKAAEEKAKAADEEFRGELKTQCETKAKDWDQRSRTRAAELTAIAEAQEALKSGVAPKYGANKKLVGLERRAAVWGPERPQRLAGNGTGAAAGAGKAGPAGAGAGNGTRPGAATGNATVADRAAGRAAAARPPAAPAVFLQLRGASSADAVLRRALQQLGRAADRLQSPLLSALAAKAELEEDHFVKVRGLIKDLIGRLEAEATAEAGSKTLCDENMAASVSERDQESMKMETQSAAISQEEATKSQLVKATAEISGEIAGLHKALNEVTELRKNEKAANAKTLADAAAGKAAVEQALELLKTFYDSQGALLQGGYTPPKADREGKTVGDRAPELSYEGDYRGKQGASKGIIGLLNVILADFERTLNTVEGQDSAAQGEFEQFEQETESSLTAKDAEKSEKEQAIVTSDEAAAEAKNSLMEATRLHDAAINQLQKLEAMCVEGEESWAERKAAREKEVEALKEALKILQEWQG